VKDKNFFFLSDGYNGDSVIDESMLALTDEKLLKWYGINVLVNHPKVVPIPLGIENKHLYVLGIPAIFNHVTKKVIAKKNKIFYGFLFQQIQKRDKKH
jgi:hypothetical protein